jgi:hypothetical protein
MAKLILVVVAAAIVLFLLFMFPVLHVSMASPTTTVSSSSISIPSSKGYVNGKIAFFIATDVSDNQTAASITKNLGYKVNFAPSLALIPESALQQGYEFVNGIKGEGAFGFQIPVASALPGDKGYSPIVQLNFVKWNNNATAKELKSAEQIMAAKSNGELEITKTNIFINSPPVS